MWINVTAYPTAEWIAQQITEAFPWHETPRYLIRDRDAIYGAAVPRLRAMGIRDKPIAPGSPWQNGVAKRLIGTIRRECVDHVVALGERLLRYVLKSCELLQQLENAPLIAKGCTGPPPSPADRVHYVTWSADFITSTLESEFSAHRPAQVLRYLSRYTHSIAISNRRLLAVLKVTPCSSTDANFQASETCLINFMKARGSEPSVRHFTRYCSAAGLLDLLQCGEAPYICPASSSAR